MKEYSSLRRKYDLIFYAVVLCVGAVVCLIAFSYPRSSSTFPRLLSIALLFIAAVSAVKAFRLGPRAEGEAEKSGEEEAGAFNRTSVVIFAMIGLYIFALANVGFFISSYCFIFGVTYFLKYRNKLVLFGWPLVLCGIIWLVFCKFLNVPTPEGFLF